MISVVESLPAHMRPWGLDLPFHSQKQLFTPHYNELTGFFKKVLYTIRSSNNSRLILANQKPREEKPSRPPTWNRYFIFL